MATLEQLRAHFGVKTDEEAILAASKRFGMSPTEVASEVGYDLGGKWGNRISASIDSYQGNLYGLAEAALGSDWVRSRRQANEAGAGLSRDIARSQGAIQSYKDVGGVGDALDYVGGLAVDSLPYIGETVVGGVLSGGTVPLLRTAGMGALRATVQAGRLADASVDAVRAGQAAEAALNARRLMGGVAASYPSSVGDILSNQREASADGETMDLGAAAMGGVPYAALNALSPVDRIAARGSLGFGLRGLDDATRARRIAGNIGMGALNEGLTETAQEGVNQFFGRMATNPNAGMFDADALDRYGESFVGGAALGGLFSVPGSNRRSEGFYNRERIQQAEAADRARQEALAVANQQQSMDLLATTGDAPTYGQQVLPGFGPDTANPLDNDLGVAAPTYEELRRQRNELRQQRLDLLRAAQGVNPADTARQSALLQQDMLLRDRAASLDAQIAPFERDAAASPQMGLFGPMGSPAKSPEEHFVAGLPTFQQPAPTPDAPSFTDFYGERPDATPNPYDDIIGGGIAKVHPENIDLPREVQRKAAEDRAADDRARRALGSGAGRAQIEWMRRLNALADADTITDDELSTFAALLSNGKFPAVKQFVEEKERASQQPVVPGATGVADGAVARQGDKPARGAGAARPVAGGGVAGAATGPVVADANGGADQVVAGAQGVDAARQPIELTDEDVSTLIGAKRTDEDTVKGKVRRRNAASQQLDDFIVSAFDRALAAGTKLTDDQIAALVAEKGFVNPDTGKPYTRAAINKRLKQNNLQARAVNSTAVDLQVVNASELIGDVSGEDADTSLGGAGFRTVGSAADTKFDSLEMKSGSSMSIKDEETGKRIKGGATSAKRAELMSELAAEIVGAESPKALEALVGRINAARVKNKEGVALKPEQLAELQKLYNATAERLKTSDGKREADLRRAREVTADPNADAQASKRAREAATAMVRQALAVLSNPKTASFWPEVEALWDRHRFQGDPAFAELPGAAKYGFLVEVGGALDDGRTINDEVATELVKAVRNELDRTDYTHPAFERINAEAERSFGADRPAATGARRSDGDAAARRDSTDDQPGAPQAAAADALPEVVVGDGTRSEGVKVTTRKRRTINREVLDGPKFSKAGQQAVQLSADERAFFDSLFANPADREDFLGEVPSAEFDGQRLVFDTADASSLEDYIGSLWAAVKKQYGGQGAKSLPRSFASAGDAFIRKMRAAPAFSKAAAGGSTVASINAELRKLKLATNGRVQVVQSIKDLPAGIKAAIEKESGTGGKVQAFVLNGRAYLVADNIAPGNARAVFMHEVGAHLGIDNLLTKAQYDNLVRKLLSWADKNDGSIESRLARRAAERAGQAQTPDVDLHSEVLAYFVEEAVKAGIDPTAMKYNSDIARWFSELIRAMKQALRKLQMFTAPDLTPQDVVDLAYGAAKLELEAPLNDSVGEGLLESRIVRDEQGNREYEGDGVRIAFPQPVDRIEVIPTNGQRVLNYAIMPADSFGVMGHVDLLVDANGVPESLLDIEVYERGRGAGEKAVAALLYAYPNRNINISNIVPEAQGFWEKLGVPVQNLEEGAAYDGTLNAKVLEQAQRERAQAAARRNAQGGGAANRGADAGAAQGVRGAIRGLTPRIQYSRISETLDGYRAEMPAKARNASSMVAEGFKKFGMWSMTNFQLTEQFGDAIPALKTRTARVMEMVMDRNAMAQEVTRVAEAWDKLSNKDALNRLMQDATLAEIHPDVGLDHPSNAHVTDKAKHAELQARYNALGKDSPAQKVYQDAKAVLEKQWAERSNGFNRMVDNLLAERGAAILARGGSEAEMEAAKADANKLRQQHAAKQGKLKGPYFPLLRFGNYRAVAVSKELEAAEQAYREAVGADARMEAMDRLEALKRDPKHYVVSAHDTKAEADAALKKYTAQGMTATPRMTDPLKGQMSRDSAAMMKQFTDALRDKLGGSAELDPALKAISDVYLANLPEMHALTRAAERIGVAGASVDMLRAFASAGQQGAFFASRMKHGDGIAAALSDIQKQAKEAYKAGNKSAVMHVAHEMAKRSVLDMEFHETPVQDAASALGYTYYLGVSPAFLMMNMLQPAMVSVPVLAGKHGVAQSTVALKRAWVDAAKIIKAARTTDGKFDPWKGVSEAKLDKANERWAMRQLIQSGIIDEGQQHELNMYANDSSRGMARLSRVIGWASQQIELVNRISTSMAAYRLALGNQDAGGPGAWTKAHEDAVEYARSVTLKTQMDYSSESTARMMREGGGVPMAKLVFQFRRFQQGMLYLLVDLAKTSFKSGPDRAAAMKSLGLMFATTGMAAGAMGLPFLSTILWAVGLGMDDDDERGPPEVRLRNLIHDTFGPELGDVVAKGLPAMFGMDLSKRLGLADVASPFPMARWDGKPKDDAKELVWNLAGPAAGLGAQFWEGAVAAANGDFVKATEKLTPKFVADIVRAGRYTANGMTDSKGNPINVPLDAGDIALRAMGIGSTSESNYYEGTKALRDVQQNMNDAKGEIGVAYRKAIRSGDFADVREMIAKWNEKHPGDRITAKQEVQWRKAEVKGAKEANAAGIRVDKAAQKYADVARFAQ